MRGTNYTQANLNANEYVLFRTRPHKVLFVGATLYAASMVALTIFFMGIEALTCFVYLLPLVAPIPLLKAAIKYMSTEYTITNTKIIYKTGLLFTSTTEAFLKSIAAVSVTQNIAGRIMDYGTVTVHGITSKQIFKRIPNPTVFKHSVEDAIENLYTNRPPKNLWEASNSHLYTTITQNSLPNKNN